MRISFAALVEFCVCGEGVLHVPAHPPATILKPRVTCYFHYVDRTCPEKNICFCIDGYLYFLEVPAVCTYLAKKELMLNNDAFPRIFRPVLRAV